MAGAQLLLKRKADRAANKTDAEGSLRASDVISLTVQDPLVCRPDGTFDETEIFAIFFGQLFAAVSNTAPSVGWVVYHLAKDAATRKRILDEWRAGVEECGGVTVEAVNRVEGLIGIVNELVRTGAPGLSFRRASSDIEFGGYCIPEGRLCLFLWNSINLNENVYPDPLKFDPSRWTRDGKEPGTNIVFGAGRHPCPGQKIVYLEFRILACLLLDRFEVEVLGEPATNPRQMTGVLRPVPPVPFRLVRRKA
eukprot:tig00020912_g15828.t1